MFDRKKQTPPPLPQTQNRDIEPIRLSVGPSPWAWMNRSQEVGGKKYRFREFSPEEKLSGVTKVLNKNDEVVLLLDFYCYARFLAADRNLLWWEEPTPNSEKIVFNSFKFCDLGKINDPFEAAQQMRATKAKSFGLINCITREFACLLDAGSYEIDSPVEWEEFEETLILANHASRNNPRSKMCRAMFVFDWISQSMSVCPQDWFNNGKYDFEYQGITRVARNKTGSIVGEGIRLGSFELDETGRNIERWLSKDPFRMIPT